MDPNAVFNKYKLEPKDLGTYRMVVGLMVSAPDSLEEQLRDAGITKEDAVYKAAKEYVSGVIADYYSNE